MRSFRLIVIGGLVALVAGCTSVVQGRGQHASAPVSPSAPASSSTSGAPSTSGFPSASAPAAPSDIARTAADTAIGDPPTADICTAIGLAPLRALGAGYTPSFDGKQYLPGCSLTLRSAGKSVVEFSIYADTGAPSDAVGRTSRTQSGLIVYAFRFDSSSGACERDLMARGIRLVVDAFAPSSVKPNQRLSCDGTDAMVNQLAAAVAGGEVHRLPLASPSISELDGCKIATKARITTLSTFAGSTVVPRGFGVNCELKSSKIYLFLDFLVADAVPHGTVNNAEGHRLYETDSGSGFCTFMSNQRTTADGRYEQMAASAVSIGTGAGPTGMCAQTAQALGRYLTAAGLA